MFDQTFINVQFVFITFPTDNKVSFSVSGFKNNYRAKISYF